MNIALLNGLAEIADDYQLFIFDLWGVVHDGVSAYPGAADCLARLRRNGTRVVLLSNAPRPSANVAIHLEELGIKPMLYDWLLTSGEATANAIASQNSQPEYFHVGPERSRPTLEACGGREVSLEEAELILCTGLFDDETERAEDYGALLRCAADRNLPMICANPDIVVMRGDKMIQCAGAVAALYEEMGGIVTRFGKPFPEVFDCLFAEMSNISRERAVMVGDGLTTDIRGARRAGIDAVWIAGGIHAIEVGLASNGNFDLLAAQNVAEEAGEFPRAVMPCLQW